MKLKKFFTTLWKDDAGQSTTEYILMLSVVVMIAMKFKKEFLTRMEGITAKVGQNIDDVVSNQGN